MALAGIEKASASFDSAATSLLQAANGASPSATVPGDRVDLSQAVVSLLSSERTFSANIAAEIVESNLTKSTFSVLG